MSSISIKRALAQKYSFAGRAWYYHFREIPTALGEDNCKKAANRLLKRYSAISKSWSSEANSEWICRFYMSAKLIMFSTLYVNSLHYAEDHNLRIVVPYLRYYSILSLLRSICYTLPKPEWQDGHLIKISHNLARKTALEYLRIFNKEAAKIAEQEIHEMKVEREFISYRAPSAGDNRVSEKNRILPLCKLLAEVAQFNSELFEASLLKHVKDPRLFRFLNSYVTKFTDVEIDGHYFGDIEDAYRLDYLSRKHPYPANLKHLMTEGHVEDFFGAWLAENQVDGLFNPDDMWEIIFDIP